MFIPDLLTRNIIKKSEEDDESMLDLTHVVKIAELKYSKKRMEELILETKEDTVLERVKKFYDKGWPRKLNEGGEINHYFKIRNDIVVENELVYFGNRVVIPRKLRSYMLKLLHKTHQG